MLLIDILELNHMAIGRMRSNQQQNRILQAILNIFGIDIIIKHEMSQYFDVVDHLFII